MGNKEFSVGTLPGLTKFPIVEDVRVVFLLYHMNITPRAITHMPTDTNKAKMSLGGKSKWVVFIYILNNIIKHIHRHGR